MKFDKIGKHVRQISNRNKDLSVTNVLGINIDKVFMPSVANTTASDLSNYKVVRKGQFATNLMHVGRDERLPIGVYTREEPAIVSPAYFTFEIIDPDELLPEFLMLIFLQPEFDRYAGFICDSSVRGNLDWERFCEVEIPVPTPEKQREYVDIYSNLLKLTNNHEKSFADLQLITNTYTEKLVEKYGTEELGGYIQQTDTRNRDLAVKKVQGISIQKKFIDSKANMDGVPLGGYKVVRPREFAYVTVTSRNGQKISIGLNDSHEPYIVSSTYISFLVTNTEELLPEFLLLWFKRPEFDRYARYNSWGSAREAFDWSEMQRVKLPVPPPSVQRSIVAIYHALEARKQLAERLKRVTKEISPVLIKDAKDKVGAAV